MKTFKEFNEKSKGLYYNIHKRRKSGKRMRKKGEKGAPKPGDFKRAAGESVDEKAPNTSDAMKRYKSGKAGFTDIAHLKAKGLIKRSDGTKRKSKKYEKLDPKKHDAGDYVKDFQKSDAPQFKGKSKAQRQKMAIAAYLSKKYGPLDDDINEKTYLRKSKKLPNLKVPVKRKPKNYTLADRIRGEKETRIF